VKTPTPERGKLVNLGATVAMDVAVFMRLVVA
jgi:hypothetical protein